MKTHNSSKTAAPSSATEHVDAARRAQQAIKQDPESPENYTALAAALRLLAYSTRERNAEAADDLLRLACAVAWEAKSKSDPALISGRTKQEVKVLIAWLRTKNHLSPPAAEDMMEQIRAQCLDRALNFSDAGYLLGFARS